MMARAAAPSMLAAARYYKPRKVTVRVPGAGGARA